MDQQESSQKSPTVISPPTSPTNADNNETSSNPRHSRRGTVFGLGKIVRGLNKSSSSSSNSKSNTSNSPQNKSATSSNSNSGDSSTTTNTLNNNNNNNRTSIPITTRTNRNSRGNSLTSSSSDGASANTKRSCRETSFHSRMQQRKASVRIVNAEALQEHIAHQLLSSDN